VTPTQWFKSTLNAVRRSPSASVLLLVLVLVLLESVPLEALVWQPSMTPALLDQALLLGFIVLVMGAMLAWYGTARPIEAALRENRHTLRSLFVGNPESIAVYDLEGRILRSNAAASKLLNRAPDSLVGAHFDSHVAPEHVVNVQAAFDRAAAGEIVELDTVFSGSPEQRVEVHWSLSPHAVNGRTVGVFGVARDATEFNRMRAAVNAQSERMADIAAIADPTRNTSSRLHGALALLCRQLQFEEAFVAEIEGERVRVLAQETASPGEAKMVPTDVLRSVISAATIVEIGDFGATTVRSFAALPLKVGGAQNIVLALTSPLGRERELDDADCHFIRAVASLVVLALERGRQDERSGQQAFYDALTGLPNRLLVIERLSDILGSPKWRGMHFAVHYIDLEGFKEINDDFGHAVGDRILRLAARRIQDSISSLDLLARLGGDEFAVVQPLPDGDSHADKMARRIMAAVAQPFSVEGTPHQLGVSIGISISSNSAPDGLSLLQHADEALYRAKHETEHRITFSPNLESVAS
jgi:diguanylate cyclase (GGDEF)-like protein/PAS domain S-box-containing protein